MSPQIPQSFVGTMDFLLVEEGDERPRDGRFVLITPSDAIISAKPADIADPDRLCEGAGEGDSGDGKGDRDGEGWKTASAMEASFSNCKKSSWARR